MQHATRTHRTNIGWIIFPLNSYWKCFFEWYIFSGNLTTSSNFHNNIFHHHPTSNHTRVCIFIFVWIDFKLYWCDFDDVLMIIETEFDQSKQSAMVASAVIDIELQSMDLTDKRIDPDRKWGSCILDCCCSIQLACLRCRAVHSPGHRLGLLRRRLW